MLHSACNGGNVSLVRALVEEHKATQGDDKNNTPLHVADINAREFGCDVQSKGFEGKSHLSIRAGSINAREDNKW